MFRSIYTLILLVHNNFIAWAANNIVSAYLLFLSFVVSFNKPNRSKNYKDNPFLLASNGLAEWAMQTFKSGMKKLTSGSLETRVARFLFTYRITPHTTTGNSPSELLLGRRLRCHLDFLHPSIQAKVFQNQS